MPVFCESRDVRMPRYARIVFILRISDIAVVCLELLSSPMTSFLPIQNSAMTMDTMQAMWRVRVDLVCVVRSSAERRFIEV